MSLHICDCGQHYHSLAAIESCQINNHGQPRVQGTGSADDKAHVSPSASPAKASPHAGDVPVPGVPSHLPWRARGFWIYFSDCAGGFYVHGCPDSENLAAFITRACNSHTALLAGCKSALLAFETNAAIDWDELRHAIDAAEGRARG